MPLARDLRMGLFEAWIPTIIRRNLDDASDHVA
jgi:hypothetical protein